VPDRLLAVPFRRTEASTPTELQVVPDPCQIERGTAVTSGRSRRINARPDVGMTRSAHRPKRPPKQSFALLGRRSHRSVITLAVIRAAASEAR
jgi:hypothetical protein